MKLTLHLQAGQTGDTDTAASVAGDVLTVDSVAYDLSAVPEGGKAEPSGEHPFVGNITRENGEIVAAILWQYNSATAEPDQPPVHPVVTITSGEVADPVVRKPVEEPEHDV